MIHRLVKHNKIDLKKNKLEDEYQTWQIWCELNITIFYKFSYLRVMEAAFSLKNA